MICTLCPPAALRAQFADAPTKLLLTGSAIAESSPAMASESSAGDSAKRVTPLEFQYGAFLDAAYIYDFNRPANQVFRSRGTTWHFNDPHLNMAGAYIKKKAMETSRWGGELLLQAGKDSEVFGYSATAPPLAGSETLRHLGLANVSFLAPIGKGLALQGGIFSSLIGYDSLYAKDNLNYTRPWGADFTPYLMLGVNASYPFSEKLGVTFFVLNGYWHLADANSVPSLGGQVAYKVSSQVTAKETVLWGSHQPDTSLRYWRVLSDSIVERKSERLIVAFEYQVASELVAGPGNPRAWWMSAQLPLRWHLRGPWNVALRPEVAWDSSGRWTLYRQTVKAVTTTLEYRIPYRWAGAIVRLEHRFDDSRGREGGFFNDGRLLPGGIGLKPTQHLLMIGLVFTLDSPASP